MLNKLLKRCMPWQQSGRWIRIYYDGLNVTDPHGITFRYPNDMTVAVSADGWSLNFTYDKPVVEVLNHMTITHAVSTKVPANNEVFGNLTPGEMIGSKGYVDIYVRDIEVIYMSDSEILG